MKEKNDKINKVFIFGGKMLPNKRWRKLVIIYFIIFIIVFSLVKALGKICDIGNRHLDIQKAEYMQENNNKGGKTYYISATGESKDGTDINKPMSIEYANMKTFYGNDKILFKRGETFYGSIEFNIVSDNGKTVYIGNYGEEEQLPILTTSYYVTNSKAWIEESEGLFFLDLCDRSNIKGYMNDNDLIYDIGFFRDEENNIYGEKKKSKGDIKEDWDFYCDDKKIYVKSSKNPTEVLGKITFSNNNNIIKLSSNTILDGIIIQDGGGHGIVKKEKIINNVHILNCVIQNIGGSLLKQEANGVISRYGNAIEFWGQAKDTIVENCIFRNIYDSAYTLQGNTVIDGFINNRCINNIFINCTYPIELSCHNKGDLEDCRFEDNAIKGNLFINQGQGFGYEVRPDKFQVANMVIWMLPFANTKLEYSDNRIYNSRALYYSGNIEIADSYKNAISADKNTYYINENTYFWIDKKQYNEKSMLEKQKIDINSKFYDLNEENIKEICCEEILMSENFNDIINYYEKFDIEYLKKMYIEEIKKELKIIKKENKKIFDNEIVNDKYEEVFNILQYEEILNAYDGQYGIADKILEEFYNGHLKISKDELIEAIKEIDSITEQYKNLLDLYNIEDNITDKLVTDKLNGVITKYNDNLDLEMCSAKEFIELAKEIYNKDLNNNKDSLDYLNKKRILNLVKLVEKDIDICINSFISEEEEKINITFDKDINILTSESITAKLNHGIKTKIVNNGGKNTYTFNKNGKFEFEVKIREEKVNVKAEVDNIIKEYKIKDKTITNVEIGTTVEKLIKGLDIENKEYRILRNNKVLRNNEKIATGDMLELENITYTLAVLGDIDCDGKVTIKDLVKHRGYLLKKIEISELEMMAADMNGDEKNDIKDLVSIRKKIILSN